jgi:hypothetical protein
MLDPVLAGCTRLLSGTAAPFFEVQTLKGVVDLLFAYLDETVIMERREKVLPALPEVSAVITLLALSQRDGDAEPNPQMRVQEIGVATGISIDHLRRRVLPSLKDSGWITCQGRSWQASHPYKIPVRSMTAVEIKRGEWRRALSQAVAHAGFADTTYVALDRASVGDIDVLAEAFEFAGVGLLLVSRQDDDQCSVPAVHTPIKARRRRPRGLSHAVVAERVLALAEAGRRSGDVGHVFGKHLTTSSGSDPRFQASSGTSR